MKEKKMSKMESKEFLHIYWTFMNLKSFNHDEVAKTFSIKSDTLKRMITKAEKDESYLVKSLIANKIRTAIGVEIHGKEHFLEQIKKELAK